MAKPKPKDDTPTPSMDDVLRRMLATPPDPRRAKKKEPKKSAK
jgi:hypothetical protein